MAPSPTATPTATPTPTTAPSNGGGGGGGNGGGSSSTPESPSPTNPVVLGAVATSQPQVLGVQDNYNPLVEGIQRTYGGVLGAKDKKLPKTGADNLLAASEKLPSGNEAVAGVSLMIGKLGLHQQVYRAEMMGNEYLVGDGEVLEAGNNVFYGHNSAGLFGDLYTLAAGDQIVLAKVGEAVIYTVDSVQAVSQKEASVLSGNSRDEIALITCAQADPDLRIVVRASVNQ